MAKDSRKVRKLRRIKRERSLAYRMSDAALAQRDQARMIANAVIKHLETVTEPPAAVEITQSEALPEESSGG